MTLPISLLKRTKFIRKYLLNYTSYFKIIDQILDTQYTYWTNNIIYNVIHNMI